MATERAGLGARASRPAIANANAGEASRRTSVQQASTVRQAEARANAGEAGKDKRGNGVEEHGAQRRREEDTKAEGPWSRSNALRRRPGRRR